MKKVYKFHWDCGRSGNISSVFVADSTDVENAIGKDIYFGEVLGKHSEIYGTLDAGDLKVLTEEPSDVALIERLKLSTGLNPLNYLPEEEEE